MTVDYTATLPAKRAAAAVLFTDPEGRVLLVEPTYKPTWEIPGGTVELNESPFAAAAREVKEELGLDHFEGRSWRGLHRHALLTLIAYLFLQHLRLQAAKGGKNKARRTTATTDPAGHPAQAA